MKMEIFSGPGPASLSLKKVGTWTCACISWRRDQGELLSCLCANDLHYQEIDEQLKAERGLQVVKVKA